MPAQLCLYWDAGNHPLQSKVQRAQQWMCSSGNVRQRMFHRLIIAHNSIAHTPPDGLVEPDVASIDITTIGAIPGSFIVGLG